MTLGSETPCITCGHHWADHLVNDCMRCDREGHDAHRFTVYANIREWWDAGWRNAARDPLGAYFEHTGSLCPCGCGYSAIGRNGKVCACHCHAFCSHCGDPATWFFLCARHKPDYIRLWQDKHRWFWGQIAETVRLA